MRILVLSSGFSEGRIHLQPWKYFHSIAVELKKLGHEVSVTDDSSMASRILHDQSIDVFIVSLGPLSRFRKGLIADFEGLKVGVVTFPIYSLREIAQAGLWNIITNTRHTYQHILGTLVARVTTSVRRGVFDLIVTESNQNMMRLVRQGFPEGEIVCIPPGVDEIFIESTGLQSEERIHQERTVVFIGSALALRGARDLVAVMKGLMGEENSVKLALWIRPDPDTEGSMRRLRRRTTGLRNVLLSEEELTQEEVAKILRAATVVVFPFRLMPSESPVGPLEALAIGANVVVPRIAGLTDLETQGAMCYVSGDLNSLKLQIERCTESRRRFVRIPQDNHTRDWRSKALQIERHLNERLTKR
jgi:glycosyltransferase involved in cell wall biosynthesis